MGRSMQTVASKHVPGCCSPREMLHRSQLKAAAAAGGRQHPLAASAGCRRAGSNSRLAAVGSQSQSDLMSIVPYAIQNGIKFAKIKPVSTSGGERGLQATFPIAAGEALCSVPATAALRLTPNSPPALGLPQQLWSGLPWSTRLAVLLLAEMQAGGASKWAGYIAVLPAAVDVPALWPEEQLQQLSCGYFIQQVQEQRHEWQAAHQVLQPFLAAAGIADSQQQLFRALAIVRSRAFAAPFTPAPLSVVPKIAAAVQLVAATAWLTQGAAAAGVVEAAGLAAAGAVAAVLLQQLQQQQQQHVLCPLLDVFNHSSSVQAECELDVWGNAFRVVADRQWATGDEVLINYSSSSSNDGLLQLYGFVEPGNPQERFLVRRLPAALVAAGLCSEEAQAPPELTEVVFTQQGVSPPAAAAALERLCCGQRQPGGSAAADASHQPYTALSSAALGVCAEAVTSEIRQLRVDEAADQALLQAFEQLPIKRAELSELEQRVQELHAACQALQRQLEAPQPVSDVQQQEEADVDEAVLAAEVATAATAVAEVQQAQDQLIQVQAQRQEVSDLVERWQENTAGVKRVAVEFRLLKHRFLCSLLQQLR